MANAIERLRAGLAAVPPTVGRNPLIESAVRDYDALAARLAALAADNEIAQARNVEAFRLLKRAVEAIEYTSTEWDETELKLVGEIRAFTGTTADSASVITGDEECMTR